MAYHETLSGRRVFYENDNGEWAMYTGEARYAYFFDLIGAKWIKDERRYYLGDTLSYLPDFTLHNKGLKNLIVEVKNRNIEQIKPIDFIKLDKMYEKGHDILVVRKPPQDMRFLKDDHDTSNCFFYSGKYIHGCNEEDMIWFKRDDHGEPIIAKLTEYSGLDFLREVMTANAHVFQPCFEEDDEW